LRDIFSFLIDNKTMSEWLQNLPLSTWICGFACVFFIALLIIQRLRFSAREKEAREDAAKRSRAVRGGQLAEQIAPFLPEFPCNPEDARFIGKPFDFIAFPGLEERDEVDEILLIEVKTGSSALSKREKEVRRAVKEGRVRYIEYRVEN